ncbi:MAG: tRNA glutamyl-Q(34) synthetase GluQRS [Allorhizobium sp.]
MNADPSQKPVFRFAPSPNGALHLGHALSALLNQDRAEAAGGRLLLRMEDIDPARCTQEKEQAILDDLAWLGLDWEEPVRRQSEHIDAYRTALGTLIDRGLVYPAFMSRGAVRGQVSAFEATGKTWPRDPDGAPHYPDGERKLSPAEREAEIAGGSVHAFRLDMGKAIAIAGDSLSWDESGDGKTGTITADPAAWGDIVLWRADAPSSYHLSVTVDDALQGVTNVVRGLDLFHATSVHRLLQHLLGLPAPHYHHHRLILGEDGTKLSKSRSDTALLALRAEGLSSLDIRRLVGP